MASGVLYPDRNARLCVTENESCLPNNGGGGNNPPDPVPNANFVKGADVSWLTQMEAAGKKSEHQQHVRAVAEGFA